MELQKFDNSTAKRPPFAVFNFMALPNAKTIQVRFNWSAIQRFGVGDQFRSANLYWSETRQEIHIELFESKKIGQRKMLGHKRGTRVVRQSIMSMTNFLRDFGVEFVPGRRYPIQKGEKERWIYISLDEYWEE